MSCEDFNRPCILSIENASLDTPTIYNTDQSDTSLTFNVIYPYTHGFIEIITLVDSLVVSHKTKEYPENLIETDFTDSLTPSNVEYRIRWFDGTVASKWVSINLFFFAGQEGLEEVVHNGISVVHESESVTYLRTERWLKHDDGEDNAILAEDGIYLGF